MKRRLRLALALVLRDHETSWTFAVLATALYVAFLSWAHVHHEAWRDEIHPWIVAKRADGFWDIVTGDRVYDGHPPLWYWYLRLWTWVTHRPWGLHAANVTVMAGVALLLCRFGPFSRLLKLGLLSSYQLTFEYGVVARNYCLGLLLVMVFCARSHPLRSRLITQAAVLGLLCLTSVYGTIMAACFFVTLLPQGARLRLPASSAPPRMLELSVRPRLLGAAVLLLGTVAFCVYTTTSPDPNPASPGWNFDALSTAELASAATRMVITFFPVRYFDAARYWGNVWAFWGDHQGCLLVARAALPVLLVVSLLPVWSHVVALVSGISLMAIVQIARYNGGPRHWGHFLILYLGLSWIWRRVRPGRGHIVSSAILLVVVLFQLESLLAAVGRDRTDLFSGGQEAAAFIESRGLQDLPLVAGPDDVVLSVTGHLGRTYISSETEEVNETMVFHGRRRAFVEATLVARALEVSRARESAVLVISNRPLPGPDDPRATFELLFRNSQDGPHGENYLVYRLSADGRKSSRR